MTLEKYTDTQGSVRYKLNGKRIATRDAQLLIGLEEVPFIDTTVQETATDDKPLVKFEVGKTYTSVDEIGIYKVVSRTAKTVTFKTGLYSKAITRVNINVYENCETACNSFLGNGIFASCEITVIPYHEYKTLMTRVEKYGSGQSDVAAPIKSTVKDWVGTDDKVGEILKAENPLDAMNRYLAAFKLRFSDDETCTIYGIIAEEKAAYIDEWEIVRRHYSQMFQSTHPVRSSATADNAATTKNLHVNCPDRLAAINLIEAEINYPFIIKGDVKGCECVYAENAVGDTLEMHDDHIKVTKWHAENSTYYWLDIVESNFIAALNEMTAKAMREGVMPETFTITGKSGAVYTYCEKTLEVIDVATSAETDINTNAAQYKMLIEKQKTLRENTGKDIKSFVIAERHLHAVAGIARAMKTPVKSAFANNARVA